MIACDTSSLVAFLEGDQGKDISAIQTAVVAGELVLPPATFTEVLSNPRTRTNVAAVIAGLAHLPILADYWLRVADTRANLISKGLKARLADALIAQSCIDADVKLITRDRDFRHFAAHCGLKLA
ncbi:MAG: PIN domain-containing protein [Vitreimonas sp.]